MQDLKKNKRRINQMNFKNEFNEDLNEELQEDPTRSCKAKGCNHNNHHDDELECNCVCKPKNNNHHNNHNNNNADYCEPCEVEADECVDNVCGEDECCNPIAAPKFSTANSVPFAIEVNRIFDSIKFQLFTEASGPNGEDLFFEYEVASVDGPIPRSGVVNVNIEKVCMNYTDVIIKTGCTNLDDHTVRMIKELKKEACNQNLCPDFEDDVDSEFCKTSFEYNVCGNRNAECCSQGKGERSVYKEKGLKVVVKNLVLELRGRCGCTEVTVLAYPAVMNCNCDLELVDNVVFNFNTLSAPMCLPVNGKSFTLRQDFQTALTVDCIGKTLLKLVDENCCECYYNFCIPNGIDLILCLEEIVSVLVNEQIVVLASPNAVDPRVVDTFAKVCDFTTCPGTNNNNNNNENGNGCNCKR
jgi:hypothetical protein